MNDLILFITWSTFRKTLFLMIIYIFIIIFTLKLTLTGFPKCIPVNLDEFQDNRYEYICLSGIELSMALDAIPSYLQYDYELLLHFSIYVFCLMACDTPKQQQ